MEIIGKEQRMKVKQNSLNLLIAVLTAVTFLNLMGNVCSASEGKIEQAGTTWSKGQLGIPLDTTGWNHATENYKPNSTWNNQCVCTGTYAEIVMQAKHGYARTEACMLSGRGYYPSAEAWMESETGTITWRDWHLDWRGAKGIYDSKDGEGSGGVTIWYFWFYTDRGGEGLKQSSYVKIDGVKYIPPTENPYDLGTVDRINQWQFGIQPTDIEDEIVNSDRGVFVNAADWIWIKDLEGAMAGDDGNTYHHFYFNDANQVLQACFVPESSEPNEYILLDDFQEPNLPFIAPCDGTLYWYSTMNQSYSDKRGGFIIEMNVLTPYAGGDGTRENPFQIADVNHLNVLSDKMHDWGQGNHFILMNDIYLEPDEATIGCIGNDLKPFSGIFDGNGHVIHDFSFNVDSNSPKSVGLFGIVDGGEIHNLGLENCSVVDDGNAVNVGTLVGQFKSGRITCCYSNEGFMTLEKAEDSNSVIVKQVGGLVGSMGVSDINDMTEPTIISDCYVKDLFVMDKGTGNNIGGLAGQCLFGKIQRSYFPGGLKDADKFIGLADSNYSTLRACVYSPYFSSTDMENPKTYQNLGWDFVDPGHDASSGCFNRNDGPSDIWSIPKGYSNVCGENGRLPLLWWEISEEQNEGAVRWISPFAKQDPNDANSPYVIEDTQQMDAEYLLNMIGENPRLMNASFVLKENLYLGNIFDFHMIGSEAYPFRGSFEGYSNGRLIIGLYYEGTPEEEYLGLFRYVDHASIERLNLYDFVITGGSEENKGALIGYLDGDYPDTCNYFDDNLDLVGKRKE